MDDLRRLAEMTLMVRHRNELENRLAILAETDVWADTVAAVGYDPIPIERES